VAGTGQARPPIEAYKRSVQQLYWLMHVHDENSIPQVAAAVLVVNRQALRILGRRVQMHI